MQLSGNRFRGKPGMTFWGIFTDNHYHFYKQLSMQGIYLDDFLLDFPDGLPEDFAFWPEDGLPP